MIGGKRWQLLRTNTAQEWVEVGDFDTVIAAAACIRELEEYPVAGVFLQVYADTVYGSDEEAFAHLEHKGRRASYIVKCRHAN